MKYTFESLYNFAVETSEGVITYNNTLYGTAESNETISSEEYLSRHPFNIFNSETHKNLVIAHQFLLRPAFKILQTSFKSNIRSTLTSMNNIYVIIFCIFFIFLAAMYLLIWRPFINGLELEVYIN